MKKQELKKHIAECMKIQFKDKRVMNIRDIQEDELKNGVKKGVHLPVWTITFDMFIKEDGKNVKAIFSGNINQINGNVFGVEEIDRY